ncbi:MAG: hypothetical protein E7485_06000 [Ruminococcaceae bacterium]|nr:hypothetical protein [Oscillospiraceae bacterium]
MQKLISMALSLVMMLTIFTGCNGQEDVYRLIKVNSFEGTVTIQREDKMDAFEGLQLVSEDTVEVGAASLLELLADSDKHIVAKENTAFQLHSAGNETSGNITIDLMYGNALFTIDNKLPEGSSFQVNTPNASLSVRGTIFRVDYDPETNTTEIEVEEGVVAVAYADGMTTLEQGDALSIKEVDGKIIVEGDTASTTQDTPENDHVNPIVYANFNFDTHIEDFEIVHASVLTYKNLLDIDLPEDYSEYPTLDCSGLVRGRSISFETVNGDVIKPFARKLVEHAKDHDSEFIQIIDEVLTDYINDPNNEITDDSYSIEAKLDPGTIKWLPEPLIFDSEFGCCKLNIETIAPEVTIYYNEKNYDDSGRTEFTDPKTGKTYYMSTASITIRGYGTSERLDPSEYTPTLEPTYTPPDQMQ